jgi:Na+-transporting NADH:ubiquinone oxidoreductase subunit D
MTEKKISGLALMSDLLYKNNQILVAILGICSALAVTNNVKVALTMGAAVTAVVAFASFFVSLLRHWTPDSVRMILQLAVISLLVISVDQLLRAYLYDLSKKLSVFVGLIITNCIVMGRAEAMAKNVPPIPAFLDGLGAGLGYAWVLLAIGVVRELFGFGTLFDQQVIPLEWYGSGANPSGYQNFGIMALAPSAFFLIAGMIWLVNLKSKPSH